MYLYMSLFLPVSLSLTLQAARKQTASTQHGWSPPLCYKVTLKCMSVSLPLSLSLRLCLCTPALASWVQALPDHLQTKGLLLLPNASPNRERLHNKQRTRETLHTARAPWEQAALIGGRRLCVIRTCGPGELEKNMWN